MHLTFHPLKLPAHQCRHAKAVSAKGVGLCGLQIVRGMTKRFEQVASVLTCFGCWCKWFACSSIFLSHTNKENEPLDKNIASRDAEIQHTYCNRVHSTSSRTETANLPFQKLTTTTKTSLITNKSGCRGYRYNDCSSKMPKSGHQKHMQKAVTNREDFVYTRFVHSTAIHSGGFILNPLIHSPRGDQILHHGIGQGWL